MTAAELFEKARAAGFITADGARVMVTMAELEDLETAAYEDGREDGYAAASNRS